MTRARMFGCWAFAVTAMAVVGASSASAGAPDFGRCVKVAKGTGTYATGNCTTTEGVNKNFDWVPGPGPNPQFTITVKAEEKHPFYIEGIASKSKITCLEATATGEVTGSESIGPISPFEWTGCEAAGIGPENNLIPTEVASGQLGVWQEGEAPLKNKLGLEFVSLTSDYFFTGHAIHVELAGDVIGKITMNNSMTLAKRLEFQSNPKGKPVKQIPDRFVGEPPVSLTQTVNGSPEGAVIVFRSTITFAEKMEINSVF